MKFEERRRGIEPGPAEWQSSDITIRPRWLDREHGYFLAIYIQNCQSNAATGLKKAAKAATDLKKAVWQSRELTIT